ncbi:MAG: ATP-binding cassette domain-containing protein, partial [Propioniciclava sp.]
MTAAIITLDSVRKGFRHRSVIRDAATVEVRAGEALAIRGANGSGKSVLLRIMTGLLVPDGGTVQIDPRYLPGRRTFPDSFGVIIDRPGFIPTSSGRDNLLRLAAIRGIATKGDVDDAMRTVGLDPSLGVPAARYSLGMRQKLALAQ